VNEGQVNKHMEGGAGDLFEGPMLIISLEMLYETTKRLRISNNFAKFQSDYLRNTGINIL
jgi:hypothetical protein